MQRLIVGSDSFDDSAQGMLIYLFDATPTQPQLDIAPTSLYHGKTIEASNAPTPATKSPDLAHAMGG